MIGVEITTPEQVSVTVMNRLLRRLGESPVKRADLTPLKAA